MPPEVLPSTQSFMPLQFSGFPCDSFCEEARSSLSGLPFPSPRWAQTPPQGPAGLPGNLTGFCLSDPVLPQVVRH